MTLQLSNADFEQQFAAASQRAAARRQRQPLATSVRYDTEQGVMIELNNDCLVCVPLRYFPELAGASPTELRRVRLMGVGQAIEWPTLDQQFDVIQLLADAVGVSALMTEIGQRRKRVKSKTKIAAARANGSVGGRRKAEGGRRNTEG